MAKRCAIYARVSTDKQGESLENQVVFAQEFIARFLGDDYVLDESCIYQDFDMSGYYTRFMDRDAIQRALSDANEKKFDVIVFKELSRISRDQAEHMEIIGRFNQRGVRLIGINDNLDTDNPQSMDFLGIRSWMSEMESKRISSRVSSAKKSIAKRGLWVGEAPIGYTLNRETRTLNIDDTFAGVVRTIFDLYVNGSGTYKIAEYLNTNNMLSKNGLMWSRVTVNRVLRNHVYVGDTVYGKTKNKLERLWPDGEGYVKRQGREKIPESQWTVVPNTHPALIDRGAFRKVQDILAHRSRHNPRRAKHPLSGILRCSKCGVGMICQKRTIIKPSGDKVEYRYYYCASAFKFGRVACEQKSIQASKLEKQVLAYLVEYVKQCKEEEVSGIHDKTHQKTLTEHKRQIKQLELKLRKSQTALDRLLTSLDIPENTYNKLKSQYVADVARLEFELATLRESLVNENHRIDWYQRLEEMWREVENVNSDNLDETRKVFTDFLDSVIINDKEVETVSLKVALL